MDEGFRTIYRELEEGLRGGALSAGADVPHRDRFLKPEAMEAVANAGSI
jgi:hypothetical protein